jgi:hypothetical protein
VSLSYAELEKFYEGLVSQARNRGIVCAITRYRGNLSPPLNERWLRGGWTSHFVWGVAGTDAYLDVFGVAPRGTSRWDAELEGFYASRHTVAEMKRTNRDRDWPFVTALGAQMLEAGDARGWLHIFDEDLLRELTRSASPPIALRKRRPLLDLAKNGDPRLRSALHAEVQFWHELDRVRLRLYEKAIRVYMQAVKRSSEAADAPMALQHETRLLCAEKYLPLNPLADYGVTRMIEDAKQALAQLTNPAALEWLPEVQDHFRF